MASKDPERESRFRAAVRALIASGRYPRHSAILDQLGASKRRSGFSPQQMRWRAEELAAAGYDANASRKARELIAG